MSTHEQFINRRTLERDEDWDSFCNLPAFSIPPGVKVQLIPPVGGAFARLFLWKDERRLSIYFDANDSLGCVGQPYYEIYPNLEQDTERFLVGEEDKLAESIAKIFSEGTA